jgi:hypothetical protein
MDNGDIDLITIKAKVIQASCGICALSELELLQRLERLYVEGIQEGVALCTQRTRIVLDNLKKESA